MIFELASLKRLVKSRGADRWYNSTIQLSSS